MNMEFLSTVGEPYCLMSAMRGPDHWDTPHLSGDLYTLKSQITARLRATVFTPGECHGMYMSLELTKDEYKQIAESLNALVQNTRLFTTSSIRNTRHFLSHLRDALLISTVQSHPVWGGYGPEIHRALMNAMNICDTCQDL